MTFKFKDIGNMCPRCRTRKKTKGQHANGMRHKYCKSCERQIAENEQSSLMNFERVKRQKEERRKEMERIARENLIDLDW